MLPLIMLGLSLAQKKQQQNAADTQQLANNMNAASQAPQPQVNLQSNFSNAGSLLNPQFETEEERKRRLGF